MTWSEDGRSWWDGTAWRPVGPDNRHYSDGTQWLPIPEIPVKSPVQITGCIPDRQPGSGEARPDDALPPPVHSPPRSYRAAAVARVVVWLALLLLTARVLGTLISPASPSSFLRFVDWLTAPLVAPFRGSFVDRGSIDHILEISTLVALAAVALVGWGLVVVIRRLPARRREPVAPGRRSALMRALPVVVKSMLVAVLVVVALRAVLLGAGASSQSAFVNVVLHVSSALVAPFQSIVADGGTATNTIEFASLLAIIVYAIIGMAVVQVLRVLATPPGTRPVTIRQAKSPFDGALTVLALLAYAAGFIVILPQYSFPSIPVTPDAASASHSGDVSISGIDTGGGNNDSSTGGSGGSVTTVPTSAPVAHAYCAVSVLYSQNGVNWYHRVDTTSSDPCYSHWTVHATSGANCGMFYGGGQYAAPANLWNISQWGQDRYYLYVYFNDGRVAILSCVIDLGNYPQTSLYRTDWG